MLRELFKKNKLKNKNMFVEPDEIFLDSKNFPNFNRQQFEGRIEKPISKKNVLGLGIIFILCTLIFSARLGYLQIEKGQAYFQRSENNTLEKQIIFADRGIIYDRNKTELAWNTQISDQADSFSTRSYLSSGFSHLLGYVSYPMKDKYGKYWQNFFIGKDGLEK